jgi:hypothetical protein
MSSPIVVNFMKQQGFADEPADACNLRFEGLYFQPRIMFPTVLLAIGLQWPWLFLAASAVLWWNVIAPRLNPFELAYNRWIAAPRGRVSLTPAPAPRRFAQAMAAAFSVGAGLTLLAGWPTASRVFQALLVLGFSLLLFGKFCLGAYLFHVLRGEAAFANSTLPWARRRAPGSGCGTEEG